MGKIVVASIVAALLAILLAWQSHRWEMVNNCHATGGVWDGASSKCRLVPARIFIGKDLKRI